MTFAPYRNTTEALFGSETLDESLRILADVLYNNVTSRNIEIEGKVGKLIEIGTDRLFVIPQLRTESLLNENQGYRFQSTLTLSAFENLNKAMNRRFQALHENRQYTGPKIIYSKVKEIDRFYKRKQRSPQSMRISIDPETMEKKRAIVKNKLQHLDFLCPHSPWDFRITLSEELEIPIPPEEEITPTHERHKDRLSYQFDIWRIEITVVRDRKCYGDRFGEFNQPTYEVEMECSTEALLHERQLLKDKLPNRFTDYAKTFLANMRTLSSQCGFPHMSTIKRASDQVSPVHHMPNNTPQEQQKRKHGDIDENHSNDGDNLVNKKRKTDR